MRRIGKDQLTAIAMITPSLLAIGLFVYGFIGWTGWVSLSNWDGLRPDLSLASPIVRNFERLFQHVRFQADIRNTITFTLLFLGACLLIGFLLAVLLDQRVRGENIFRSIFLFPMAVSFIVTGVVWRWLMTPSTGLNLLFDQLGLGFLRSGWFTDPNVGIKAVVIAATWQMSGFVMAMYLAGLRGIPEELREAARVDGASEFQIYRSIILPLLQPITLSAVIILGHISLKIFDLTASMTKAGPGFSTDVPGYFMFETTFQGDHYAQGAAIAVIMLLMVSVLVVPYLLYSIRTEAQV
jgi:glucose/mannose transport system permease protein